MLSRSFPRVFLALFLFAAALAGGIRADEASPRDQAALTFIHINDVYLAEPVDGGKAGGLARVASLKKQLGQGRPAVMTLGGDFLSPSVASSVFKGKQMVDALNAAGLDVATLGNHEFDFGPEVLRERMKEAKWQWVVSNILDEATGEPIGGAAPYLVKEYGGLKVGYLGLVLTGEEISRDKLRGIKMTDPFAAAARYLPLLKREKVDLVVALTHLDFADDRRLAARFPEIRLILGGHEHFAITAFVNGTLITKADSDARTAARVDVTRPKDGPVGLHFELVPITEKLPDEPETAKVAVAYNAQLDKALDVVVGRTTTPLDAVSERLRSGETNLGNLMADAVRANAQADMAILNAGSIRSNRVFEPGPVARRDVVAIHPFGGTVVKVEVPGSVVLEALNHGVSRLGESVGRFPQVSGVTFRVDPAAPAGARVRDVKVNGQPLDLKKQYTVAITDYQSKGGDGYSMFAKGKMLVGPEHGDLLITALENRIREHGEVSPKIEGRIVFAGAAAPAVAKKPILLDTDMGIDSVLGMLYLLKSPEVDLRAVTTVHGVAEVQTGARNALRVLELTGNRAVPVAAGAAAPLDGQRAFPTFWKEQANTLGGVKLPEPTASLSPLSAPDLILAELEQSPEPVTLVAMGPLTNVALALRKKPEAAKKIREIVAMGGAVKEVGNVGTPFVGIRNASAEWNVYLDPHAAREVFASGVPVRLIPLDATRSLPVTPAFLDRVREAQRDQTSDLLLALLTAVRDGIEGGWYYFWDALAAVAAARPEVLGAHEERLEVVTDDGLNYGQTKVVPGGGLRVRVGEEVNREAFEADLLKTILQ